MPVANQSATEDGAFTFTVPANTFADVDAGDTLGYSATKADGTALPVWLSFDAATRRFSGVGGGGFLAPFAQVNAETFFAFGAANSDGISHFRSLGNNLFGLEDIAGGGDLDYDDLVIGFNFTSII